MNNLFEEKRTLFLLLLSVIFLGLLALYLFYLQPLSAELRGSKNTNVSLEGDIAVLEAKKNPVQQKDMNTLLLQKKVPLDPELEKLLLTFQEIEQVSSSRIDNINFLYDGSEPEFDFVQEEDDDDTGNVQNPAAEDKQDEPDNDDGEDEERPEKLHLITAKLEVLSPDYDHFIQFLQEIEKLERVARVDQLQVNKPTEEVLQFQEAPDETISFNVDVTTFYYKK